MDAAQILEAIKTQGDVVKAAKAKAADKSEWEPELKKLLELKADYTKLTGDAPPAAGKDPKKKKAAKQDAPETGSKNAVKKAKKDAEKAAKKAAVATKLAKEKEERENKKAAAPTEEAVDEGPNDRYGGYPSASMDCGMEGIGIMKSADRLGLKYTLIKDLSASMAETRVRIRGRVESIRGTSTKMSFFEIRQKYSKVQAIISVGAHVTVAMVKYAQGIPPESVIEIEGVVKPGVVTGCSIKDCEIAFDKIYIISKSAVPLPIQISDAARPENHELGVVNQDTRLNNRYIDLRTTQNQAIFRIQSAVCMYFREYLLINGFQEIHTPKIIPCASEGGADVFSLQYFGSDAFLAQSPQLYKQMAINSDFDRVFEIGPVFRSEDSNTHRHLCEFTGLDLEMAFNEHYHEVLDMMDSMFIHIFMGLQEKFGEEIETVREQFDREPFQFLVPSLRLEWPDAIQMLRESGEVIGDFEDIDTRTEKRLGALVKAKYHTDFYILDKFPLHIRPFYTMDDPARPGYSNSYDFFMRGEEIMSGAQRVHDAEYLTKRAKELGVDLSTIQDYLKSFKYGSWPHAGGGVGMERVAMLFLGLPNIRKTSMFPRDPKRFAP